MFRRFDQPPGLFSWWDYRQGGFRRNHGLRIDLMLASTAQASRCREAAIDREPRRAERPSDHAPAVAGFEDAGIGVTVSAAFTYGLPRCPKLCPASLVSSAGPL